MRRVGFVLVLLAAIPAVTVPLLAGIAAICAPAAVIAGIAAIAVPSQAARTGADRLSEPPK